MSNTKKAMVALAALVVVASFIWFMFMDQVQVRYNHLDYDQILSLIPDGIEQLTANDSNNQTICLSKQDLSNLKDTTFHKVDLPKEYKEILILPGDNYVISILEAENTYYLATMSFNIYYSGHQKVTAKMDMKYEYAYTSEALQQFVKERNLN